MSQASQDIKSEHLHLVIDADTKMLLERAAEVEQRSVGALVIEAARQRASSVLAPIERIVVSSEEFARILEELDQEPEASAALRAAFERARGSQASTSG